MVDADGWEADEIARQHAPPQTTVPWGELDSPNHEAQKKRRKGLGGYRFEVGSELARDECGGVVTSRDIGGRWAGCPDTNL